MKVTDGFAEKQMIEQVLKDEVEFLRQGCGRDRERCFGQREQVCKGKQT